MEIAFHIGASCTDEERLLKSLLKNAEKFEEQGVIVPRPKQYRRLVRETIHNLNGMMPAPDTRDILIDAILMHREEGRRLVLSNPDFICVPNRIFENGEFYALAAEKAAALRDLFPRDRISFYLGMRDPGSFVPATFAQSKANSLDEFLRGMAPSHIRWSKVIKTLQDNAPGVPITVWCNEDTPLIWAQLIREVSGVDPMTRISGGFDLLQEIMSPEGLHRFLIYIKSHPPQTEAKKRKIIATFLERFALEDEMTEEVELPGWDEQVLDSLTELYEHDLTEIEQMPGVRFIQP